MDKDGLVLVLIVLAVLYIISPIDFIPDVIPVAGWADDALVAVGAGALCLKS